jgi:hypothetical protein
LDIRIFAGTMLNEDPKFLFTRFHQAEEVVAISIFTREPTLTVLPFFRKFLVAANEPDRRWPGIAGEQIAWVTAGIWFPFHLQQFARQSQSGASVAFCQSSDE